MTDRELIKNLYTALLALKSEAEIEKFLGDLLTPTELESFAGRWEVAQQLSSGKTQRAVAKDTGVALVTVTRVNKFLNSGFGGYKLLIDRLHHSPAQELASTS
jgi:TrpR-related protein YerC/YecD